MRAKTRGERHVVSTYKSTRVEGIIGRNWKDHGVSSITRASPLPEKKGEENGAERKENDGNKDSRRT